MIASVCGVPRFRNSATTFRSSISLRAFSAASLGSNLSSSDTSSIFWPCTPPLALMLSMYSLAPSVVSFTPAATAPVKPAVWPIRICAWAFPSQAPSETRPAANQIELFMLSPCEFFCWASVGAVPRCVALVDTPMARPIPAGL